MTGDRRQGTLFAGRYLLERKLGSGGMADVWLAQDQELSRNVAVKVLHERYANDEQFVERFRREATHAAGLSHPNIVSIFDRGEAEGSYYIVMEYVEGRTLKELIVTRGACPVPVAISYVRQVLAALRYAHRNGIIHRDIKPHNVIVDREGRAKVADFGIARAGTSQMTEAGSIIGTAQYLSPEQARGSVVDESSDLYSTGIVLYELLTGTVPFTGDTPVEIAMKHLSTPPAPPSTLRHEIPHDLDLVVLRALAKEPIDRYRSAQEMDHDLELVARGEPVGRETEEAATMVLRGETTAATAAPPACGDQRRRALPRLRRRGAHPAGALAVVARRGRGAGARDRWVLRVERAERPHRRRTDGGSRQLRGHRRGEGGRADHRRRLRAAGFAGCRTGGAEAGTPSTRSRRRGRSCPRAGSSRSPSRRARRRSPVPSLVGKTRDDAVKELTGLGLDANVVEVNSQKQGGIVIAQDPSPGTVLVSGSSVRVNVSKGPKPVAVPNVVGLQVDIATSQLNTAGFPVLPCPGRERPARQARSSPRVRQATRRRRRERRSRSRSRRARARSRFPT